MPGNPHEGDASIGALEDRPPARGTLLTQHTGLPPRAAAGRGATPRGAIKPGSPVGRGKRG